MENIPRREIAELIINGETYEIAIEPHYTLLEVLREILGLTGTKEGCGTGECGSCTVLIEGEPVLSCLILATECQGRGILTIEGVAGPHGMSDVQRTFLEKGAVQCGFCTPGMVLAATALLERTPNPSDEEIKEALEGHLCRCTGYNKIVEAVEAAAARGQARGR
jgi:carbon-monoxide dehydrogenase small subunit